jgi:hypothetical protein
MLYFALSIVMFGLAGMLMHELPAWRMVSVTTLTIVASLLMRSSGVI